MRALITEWIRGEDVSDDPHWPLLSLVATLDAALLNGFHLTLGDVRQDEFRVLLVLREERERWRDEQARRDAAMAEGRQRSVSNF